WPKGDWLLGPAEYFAVKDCDVLILCEVLEHVENPGDLVDQWLPRAKNVIISHQLDEPVGSHLSGDVHVWSCSEKDFDNWFVRGDIWIPSAFRVIFGAIIAADDIYLQKNSVNNLGLSGHLGGNSSTANTTPTPAGNWAWGTVALPASTTVTVTFAKTFVVAPV